MLIHLHIMEAVSRYCYEFVVSGSGCVPPIEGNPLPYFESLSPPDDARISEIHQGHGTLSVRSMNQVGHGVFLVVMVEEGIRQRADVTCVAISRGGCRIAWCRPWNGRGRSLASVLG